MKTNIKVAGHKGTWYEIDSMVKNGEEYFLMEHETYGDMAACVIIDKDNNLIMEDVCDGFDDLDTRIIAYKLMRVKKDGKLYPLFINKTVATPIGVWLEAECHPAKGFAVRQGWHCCFSMNAPHLKRNLASGERRVWVKCLVEDYTTYDRPESQGGSWILANKMKVLEIIEK